MQPDHFDRAARFGCPDLQVQEEREKVLKSDEGELVESPALEALTFGESWNHIFL